MRIRSLKISTLEIKDLGEQHSRGSYLATRKLLILHGLFQLLIALVLKPKRKIACEIPNFELEICKYKLALYIIYL